MTKSREKIDKYLYKVVVGYIILNIICFILVGNYNLAGVESIILILFVYFMNESNHKIDKTRAWVNYVDIYGTFPQKTTLPKLIQKISLTSIDNMSIKRKFIEEYILADTDDEKNYYSERITFLNKFETSPIILKIKKG